MKRVGPSPVLVIDVAHPPRSPGEVEEQLLHAWSEVRNSPALRIIKVIHGYGKSGKGGSTKDVVRDWAYRHAPRLKGVIDGEDYSLYNASTRQLREEVGAYADGDLGGSNPGITIVWVK